MKKKTVVVKKEVELNVVYLLKAFDKRSSFLECKYMENEPSAEDIAEFIETQNAYYCTVEERYFTNKEYRSELFEDNEDEDDDWDI